MKSLTGIQHTRTWTHYRTCRLLHARSELVIELRLSCNKPSNFSWQHVNGVHVDPYFPRLAHVWTSDYPWHDILQWIDHVRNITPNAKFLLQEGVSIGLLILAVAKWTLHKPDCDMRRHMYGFPFHSNQLEDYMRITADKCYHRYWIFIDTHVRLPFYVGLIFGTFTFLRFGR